MALQTRNCNNNNITPLLEGRKITAGNFRDGRFHNSEKTAVMTAGTGWDTFKKMMAVKAERVPLKKIETSRADPEIFNGKPSQGLYITWIGHSTVLMEIDGSRILFDPMWSRRCSPVPFFGPSRFHGPPFGLDRLPELTAVLISHDHYDHLDRSTITVLGRKGVIFYTPRGVGSHLNKWGVDPELIIEMDWWEETAPPGMPLSFIAAPARHFSGRGIFSRNSTQWCSWIVISEKHRVYFGGDGGLTADFNIIGNQYGPFDCTMLEVGAYHENWGKIHLGPHNAEKAHAMLKGNVLLPIHWGTFNLALHPWYEPAETLYDISGKRGLNVIFPRPGERIDIDSPGETLPWWREFTEVL